MKQGVCLLALFFCLVVSTPAEPQTKTKARQEESRGIVAAEFLKARPAKSGAPARRAAYRRVTAKTTAETKGASTGVGGDFAQLGLTIWRLRPAKAGDKVRTIVQEGADAMEWTPERVEANTPMRVGDRIRFSFESPRAGYLYVIDREQYADGSLGESSLIFPTTRTRSGDNRVAPGRIIEIPGQEDRPNYLRLKQTRMSLVGESLVVIVTPQPLEGITIGERELPLSKEQVARWEKTWGAEVERFEMTGGAGKTWTRAEKEAGADATRQLTQEDPGPQTIYRVAVKPDQPILVKVRLRYARTTARPPARR
ncbi:MAG: DUF4384 domain-containing protein [Acidobacteriota bacterium]